jgi:class 3 adenylate cyclase
MGTTFDILVAGSPVNVAYRLTAVPVPEPTSLTLVGLGAAGLVWRRWRRK